MTYPSTVDSHRSFFGFITTFGFSSGCTESRTTTSGTLVEGALMVASRVLPLPLAPPPLVSREFDICVMYVCSLCRRNRREEKIFISGSIRTPLVGVVYRSRLPYFLCRHPSTLFFGDESHSHLSVTQPTRDPVFSGVRYASAMQPPKCSSRGFSSAIPGFSRKVEV